MTDCCEFMNLPSIDIHGHIGKIARASAMLKKVDSVGPGELVRMARACRIQLTCVSDLGAIDPEGTPEDISAGNQCALNAAEQHEDIRFYAVLSPTEDNWQTKASDLFGHPKCAGAKLHPRWNHWDIDAHGDRVFGFLNEHQALALAHTGNAGTEPERFVPFANKYPKVNLILAHLGHDAVANTRDRQIKAAQLSTQSNVWVDVSSMNSIQSQLIEYAVEQITADKVLFGSDTPLHFPAMYKARIAYADIPPQAKRKILYNNAALLLKL